MRNDFILFKDLMNDTIETLRKTKDSKNGITGISTGFSDLDNVIKGLHHSSLNVIASRPAMGKSSLALNIGTHVAVNEKKSVVIFNLELSKSQLIKRILSSEAMIDKNKINTGYLNNNEWKEIIRTSEHLSSAEIYIDDTPGITTAEIREKCIKLKEEKNIGLVVIDYLQLIKGSNEGAGNREQEISEISKSLKLLAKELDIPVIVLSQLSKTAEKRQDHRPILSDLIGSRAIVQDTDVIMFLYRDSYYYPDTENKNIAEIIIAKNRYGDSNNSTVKLSFLLEYLKFENIEKI